MNTTSLTLQAKLFGLSILGIGIVGITIASPLVVDTPSLDNIKIGKIFLSTSGTATTSGQSKITLDGSNGSIELEGALRMPGYGNDCPTSTGCILGTDADGKVKLSSINIIESFGGGTTESGDPTPSFFTRRGGATQRVDTGASEIVFYDRTIIGNNASSDVSLRIGLSGAINSVSQGNGKTVDVAGPIMSRTALSLESPIDVSKSADYPFSPNRTSAVIQKSTSSDTIEAMKLQVGHTTDDGASYDRSDFIIESLSNSIKARLGINTPNYPSKELDINGQTLSRGDLIVGSGSNPTLFANTSTKKVGINTTPSRATFDVNGSSKFNGSLSIQGTPEHIANITNGMTSITLGEITSNETGNLRTLADVGCKLLTVDSNGNLVLEQIPDDICRGTSTPVQPATTPTCDRYLPFMDNSISNECTLKIKRNGGNNVSTVSVTAIVANHDSYDFTIATGQSLSTEEIVINESCANLQIGITGQNSCNNYFRGSGFGLCELNDGDPTLPSSTVGQLIAKKEYFCTDANGGRYDDSLCPQPKPTLSYLGNQNNGNRRICPPQVCTELDTTRGCFTEDTFVTLANGTNKKIQDIVIGDVVKGVSTNNTVVSLIRPLLGNKHLYAINDTHEFVTANHPFLTTKGWKSLDPIATQKEIPDLTVGLLEIGDTLITTSGTIVIQSIITKTALPSTQLYNFELDGDHTYFANGFAVHNKVTPIGGVAVPLLPGYPYRTLLRSESCTRNSDCNMTSPGGGSNNHTSQPSFAACDGEEKVCGGNVIPNRVACGVSSCTQPLTCTADSQCCGDTICQTTAQCVGTRVAGSIGVGGIAGPYEGRSCSNLPDNICKNPSPSGRLIHGCMRRESTTKTCGFERV